MANTTKVLVINGSYRDDGITDQAVEVAVEALANAGAETEIINLRDYPIEFCLNCRECTQQSGNAPGRCVLDDGMHDLIDKIEAAHAYVRERVQFGKPLTGQQFVRFTLADMATRLEAGWRLTLHAARLVDAGQPHGSEAAMAKLFSSEACSWTCERALHLCGAQGYMRESAPQRFYRDCKVLELGEGTSEILRETIARNLEL